MTKYTTKEYAALLKTCEAAKSPIFVYGGPGIGKSEIPRQVFRKLAEERGLEYLEWNQLGAEQKDACIKTPEKYYIFCDQRVAQMDVTDLRGIPMMVNTEMLETIPMSWVVYFTQEKANGTIFFDELNLAAPAVAGQAYQIINEREVADRRLGDNVFLCAAGNRPGVDNAHTYVMSFPLRDRFNEFEVYPDVKSWTRNYATGRVNPHLVAFVNWKESYLYKVDKNAANKSSTPRGISRASLLIGDMKITSNEVHQLVSISVGEGFATQFQAYCKHFKSLDWGKIYSNPKSISNFEVDKLWAIVGGMSEQFLKEDFKTAKAKKLFNQMMKVVMAMRADFAIVTLKMFKDNDNKKFGTRIKSCDDFDEIVDKYADYIVD